MSLIILTAEIHEFDEEGDEESDVSDSDDDE